VKIIIIFNYHFVVIQFPAESLFALRGILHRLGNTDIVGTYFHGGKGKGLGGSSSNSKLKSSLCFTSVLPTRLY